MKIEALKNKLSKLNVTTTVTDFNGYNKDLNFTINGLNFNAGFVEGKDDVQDFCRVIAFDNTHEEHQRRFFTSFNSLLKYASA